MALENCMVFFKKKTLVRTSKKGDREARKGGHPEPQNSQPF